MPASRPSSSITAASAIAPGNRPRRPGAATGGLARGDRIRPLPAPGRPRPDRDVRVLARWRQRARGRRRGLGDRCRDQPGAVPRPRESGPSLGAARAGRDRSGRGGRRPSPRRRTARRGRVHQRPRRRGELAPGRIDRRGFSLAQPRISRMAAPRLPPDPPRRHRALPMAGVRRRDRQRRPARPRDRRRRRAPKGEVRSYRGVNHFDIYDGPEHEAVAADEVAFLRRHLLLST